MNHGFWLLLTLFCYEHFVTIKKNNKKGNIILLEGIMKEYVILAKPKLKHCKLMSKFFITKKCKLFLIFLAKWKIADCSSVTMKVYFNWQLWSQSNFKLLPGCHFCFCWLARRFNASPTELNFILLVGTVGSPQFTTNIEEI